jgi:hypothetical protein
VAPNRELTYQGEARLTERNQTGGALVKETHVHRKTPMTHAFAANVGSRSLVRVAVL